MIVSDGVGIVDPFSDRGWRNAERASEARHGATWMRDRLNRVQPVNDDYAKYWAGELAAGNVRQRHDTMVDLPRVTLVPEAAFEWPIYRAVHLLRPGRKPSYYGIAPVQS